MNAAPEAAAASHGVGPGPAHAGKPRARARRWALRALLLVVVGIGHLAVLDLIAGHAPPERRTGDQEPILLTLSTAGGERPVFARPPDRPSSVAASPASPVSPKATADLSPPSAVSTAPAAPASQATTGQAESVQGCGMVERLQDRLGRDRDVQSALQRIPPQARSVANAVQLWDGLWMSLKDAEGQDLLAPLQSAVTATIREATPTCRSELVRGPRLVLVEEGGDTMALSLGSGVWRWSDLLAGHDPPPNLP